MIHFLRDVYFVFVLNSIYNINYGIRTSRSSFSNILPFIFNFLTHLFTEFSISSITNRSKLDFIWKTISNSLSFISRNNLWKSLSKNIGDDYLFKNKKKLVQLSYFILKIIYIDSICFKLIRDVSKNFFSFLEKHSFIKSRSKNRSIFETICIKTAHVKGNFRIARWSPLNPFPRKRKSSRGTRSREAFRASTRRQIGYSIPLLSMRTALNR